MREIKFRAWEKNLKEIIPIDSINFQSKIVNPVHVWRFFNEVELMQFTGLKDKYGREIYEGDIIHSLSPFYTGGGTIHDYDDDNYEVIWRNVGFYLKNKEGLFADFDELIEPSVIGNIYENPELLEGVK